MAGPKRPEGRLPLEEVGKSFATALHNEYKKTSGEKTRYQVEGEDFDIGHGDVAIAAITSCTNTSNPSVLIAAGLLARNAVAKGLKSKPWVKTSLAPGSQVVEAYLVNSGLQKDLDALGFNLVGFGCTTCIGNSGPLPPAISKTINDKGLIVAAVLSGNRNFEGRVSPDVQANYLASPPLVVAHVIDNKGLKIRTVATDGHRLAEAETDAPSGSEGMPGIIIPRKAVGELQKLLGEEAESEIKIEVSETKIRFSIASVVLTSKLIDGTFPDYQRVIPLANDKKLTINRQSFAAAVIVFRLFPVIVGEPSN